MGSRSKARRSESSVFVLALGLLMGFVIGFVMLLSRMPVDSGVNALAPLTAERLSRSNTEFDYYSHLPEQSVSSARATIEQPAIKVAAATPVYSGSGGSIDNVAIPKRVEPALAVEPANGAAIPTAAVQSSYFLQAGNYRLPDQAERARAAVMMLGLDAFIVLRQDSQGSFGHRVRIGPFIDQDHLMDARDRLRQNGIPYQLIRVKS